MATKKVFIGVGHGGNDPGAVANGFEEADLNLAIALACRDELKRHGVNVKMSRTKDENDDLNEEIRECNAFDPDLALDVHNNAGGGDGAEVYHSINGGKGKTLATNILNAIVAIGQNSRGVKTRTGNNGDYFGFIRCTNAPAVLIECAFVDSKDVKIIDTAKEQKAMGVAIAKGVLKTLGITYKKATTKTSSAAKKPTTKTDSKAEGYVVRITASALNVRNGAGVNYKVNAVVRKGEAFTIVETKKGWGKLKSGKGWINLAYTQKV